MQLRSHIFKVEESLRTAQEDKNNLPGPKKSCFGTFSTNLIPGVVFHPALVGDGVSHPLQKSDYA